MVLPDPEWKTQKEVLRKPSSRPRIARLISASSLRLALHFALPASADVTFAMLERYIYNLKVIFFNN